jgi:predicted acetyltransferase
MKISDQFTYSQSESNRFGYTILRGQFQAINKEAIQEAALLNLADILILRLPASTKNEQHLLSAAGFPVLHCDTLVYYLCSLATVEVQALRNNLSFDLIDNSNADLLNELVPLIFNEYKNHYFSNPWLSKEKIMAGYLEWAKLYVHSHSSSKIAWLVKLRGTAIGFATCSFNKDTNECEGVLYGVHPDYAGKGIYTDIIRFTQRYFKEKAFKKMWVSTQVQNYSVQKVWAKEGFVLKEAFDTFHINSFLSHSMEAAREFTISLPANRNHMLQKSLEEIVFNNLSELLPENEISILSFKSVFFAPLQSHATYCGRILLTNIDRVSGIYTISCLVHDSSKQINAVLYYTLLLNNLV